MLNKVHGTWAGLAAAQAVRTRSVPVVSTSISAGQHRVAASVPPRSDKRSIPWLLTVGGVTAIAAIVAATGMGMRLLPSIRFAPKELTPLTLAEIHQSLQTGSLGVTPVSDWQRAASLLEARWPDGPGLPVVAGADIRGVGVYHLKGTRLVGVSLRYRNRAVSLVVSKFPAGQLAVDAPRSSQQRLDYDVQSIGDIRVITAEKDGVQVYLMARQPVLSLLELAARLQF